MTTRSNSPYNPSFIKSSTSDAKPVQLSYQDAEMGETNHESLDSFKYDPLGYPLKNTQQLNVDWSKFENHTFFSSAEVKVNESFNKIINGYPFDGTKKDVEKFLDSLTGYEKWIFDNFPTWSGALHFSGTQVGENSSSGTKGTWISVKDKSGVLYPDIAKNNTGVTVMNPGEDDSLSLETIISLPKKSNGIQTIFQKKSSSSMGFSAFVLSSTSQLSASIVFSVASGSYRNSVKTFIQKGVYNHICLTLNKSDFAEHTLQFYVNEKLASQSTRSVRFGRLDIDESDLLIGSGSSFYVDSGLVTPTQTFSGTLDEFRLFHSVRDVDMQVLHASRGLYATPDLKLYYRFNEPSGSLSPNKNSSMNSIVLDSSGNSLHAVINKFSARLRLDMSADENNILVNEKREHKIVLFPAYSDVLAFNSSLLETAKNYDQHNPNSIIKLIPKHYLLEGSSSEGLDSVEGSIGESYSASGDGMPGQGKMGSTQIILSFLYIWSKFFDELKLYADSFGNLRTVRYDLEDTIPDNFLEDLVREYGFTLPNFFNHATVEQFAEGNNIEGFDDTTIPLKKIQSILLRRALVNIPDVMRSKGTQHSIKSFLRSIGVDPNNSIKLREYGGPTTKQLTASREKRTEPAAMVDFISSSFVITPPLSSSRSEPGWPYPVGNWIVDTETQHNRDTDNPGDGLLTSGSWNLSCVFKMPPQKKAQIIDESGYQSLFRLITTGSALAGQPALIANVIATQFVSHPEKASMLQAFIRPGMSTSSPLLTMNLKLKGEGLFDGEKWNVSLGCARNDEIDSNVSSSYYLRAAKLDDGDISEFYVTSSYFEEAPSGEGNVFRDLSTLYNASGSYITFGSNQVIPSSITYPFLNDTLNVDDIGRTVDYEGWASNLRFWSKSMSIDAWKEHARNPMSAGVDDPRVNYNFVKNVSGSFEKLRLETFMKQTTRTADGSGIIKFPDYSSNLSDSTGTGYPSNYKAVVGDIFTYSHLSPGFDESATDDKIRIRSFESLDLLAENPWAVPAPSYLSESTLLAESPQDDLRLSLEFSMMDSLDRDIMTMFSSLDALGDIIGSPEMMFSPDYPDLENLRDVYFNRLSSKPDFRKFLEFYRWFDISISTFVEQLVPSKTHYKGTNYVVESHMLERHKYMYKHDKNYVGEKQIIQDSLLVQQIVGKFKKY